MDLEMTGLDPREATILEIAAIVTDAELQVIAEGPDLVISQPASVLDSMNEWNQQHHAASGLLDEVRSSAVTLTQAETAMLEFVQRHCPEGQSPLCGNSIHRDRQFLEFHMPSLASWAHYRNVDVSSVKELARRWYPEIVPAKRGSHRALDDIRESIAELALYRASVFR
jgi:oligoribonuclease